MKKVVRFKSSFEFMDDIVKTIYSEYRVEADFVKVYKGVLYTLHSLPTCARNLIDYLSHNCSDSGWVDSLRRTRDRFNDSYVKGLTLHYMDSGYDEVDAFSMASEKKFKDNTISHAYSLLGKRGLLIKDGRTAWRLNPEYFFFGSEKDRLQEIKAVLEFSASTTEKDILEAKAVMKGKTTKNREI